MTVTPAAVKELRDKTGAGMMDCKKALVEADGDMAKAEKLLKEAGLAAAAKRMGRTTNEGRVFSRLAGSRGKSPKRTPCARATAHSQNSRLRSKSRSGTVAVLMVTSIAIENMCSIRSIEHMFLRVKSRCWL